MDALPDFKLVRPTTLDDAIRTRAALTRLLDRMRIARYATQ